MTMVLPLCLFGLVYGSFGVSTEIIRPANAAIEERENVTENELNTDNATVYAEVAADEAAIPEVVTADEAITPPVNTMISKPKDRASIDKAAVLHANTMIVKAHEMVITDEAVRERLAIARVQERSSEETEYAAIAAAQTVAENARTSMAAKLEQLHKNEISEREQRLNILKQAIDAAFARKPGFNLLKRKPTDNVTTSEAEAVDRVQERTREELVYKTIAAALAHAEHARIAAVAELEKMHEHERESRENTEAALKAALDVAVATQ